MTTRGDVMIPQKQTYKTHKITCVDWRIQRPEPAGPTKNVTKSTNY